MRERDGEKEEEETRMGERKETQGASSVKGQGRVTGEGGKGSGWNLMSGGWV